MKTRITKYAGVLTVLAFVLVMSMCTPQVGPMQEGTIPAPVFSLEGGVYEEEVEVAISTSVQGARVYFTTDGTDPGPDADVFTSPIMVPADEEPVQIRAVAVTSNGRVSGVAEKTYTVKPQKKVATPKMSPKKGTYSEPIEVTITSATKGAVIRYTIDGSKPEPTSPLYTGPIPIGMGDDILIKAVAYKPGLNPSSFAISRYAVAFKPTDERLIVFASMRDYAEVELPQPHTRIVSELYSMTASGENQTRLTTFSPEGDGYGWPMDFSFGGAHWSPDGNKIAYRYVENKNPEQDYIYIINKDGTGKRNVAWSQWIYDLDWSPDGQKIAYAGVNAELEGPTGITIVNTDGTGRRTILDMLDYIGENDEGNDSLFGWDDSIMHPSWSPDSNRIVFSVRRRMDTVPVTYPGELWIINADGTGLAPIPGQTGDNRDPNWHPLQDKIVYAAVINGQSDIYVMNADGTGAVNLTNNPADDIQPDWSQDGSKIAFTTYRDGNAEIYVMNADGSNPVNVSNHPADDFNPGW